MNEDLEDAWKLVKAIPAFSHEEGWPPMISMGDVWAWASADAITVTDDNVKQIAKLYSKYGFCGLVYYQCKVLGEWESSEFVDINRYIEFVDNEERICQEVPDYNARGYAKRTYIIGKPPEIKQATGRALSQIGNIWNLKRRWWGLEPDFLFRKRVIRNIK